jgi:hypothetical protein
VEAVGLLGVAGSNLLNVSVVERGIAVGTPHVNALGADVDVDACVVPAEEPLELVRGIPARESRELVGHLARVAPAVGLEVRIVDLGGALDEHERRIV